MNPYIVFVRNLNEDDCYLYTVQAKSITLACTTVWDAFVAEHAPENYRDWRVKGFDPVFSSLPARVARVDRQV